MSSHRKPEGRSSNIVIGRNLNSNASRTGIIPYCIKRGVKYFLLGEDSEHSDITDFSGGRKTHESSLYSAWRELHEETLGIFKCDVDFNTLKDSYCIYDANNVIVFLKIDCDDKLEYVRRFSEKQRNTKNPEIKSISWYSELDFISLLDSEFMYIRPRRVLTSIDIREFIKKL